ncbi:MAG: phospholipase D family protein, partial [Nitrososphaerota archaeon]
LLFYITATLIFIILILAFSEFTTKPSSTDRTEFLTSYLTISRTETVISTVTHTVTKIVTETITKTELYEKTVGEVIDVCFSATEDCLSKLIYWINRANRSIHVMIYSFTEEKISEALVRARNKGVSVEVVFEKDQVNQYSEYDKLRESNVKVYLDGNRYTMHHKVMIIDSYIVVTGSYNWSYSAEHRNDENFVIIKSERIGALFEKEFERIKKIAS